MTVITWICVVLAGLMAAVVAIGYLLPRDHVATRHARVPARPDAVWTVLSDHAAETQWRSGLRSVARVEDRDGHAVWEEVDRHGQRMLLETIEHEPPRRLVRRIVETGLPFGGRWIVEIAPDADGSIVTVTEEGQVHNPVFRFVSRFVFGHTATIDAYLTALGRRFGVAVAVS